MKNFNTKDVIHISEVYKIPIDKQELRLFKRKLTATVKHLESFREMEKRISMIEPLQHPSNLKNALREDRIEKSLKIEDVFSNTLKRYKNYFVCPGVFNEK